MPSLDYLFSTSLTYEAAPGPADPSAPETVTSVVWSSTGTPGKLRGGELITLTAEVQTSRGRVLPAEFGSVFVASGGGDLEVRAESANKRSITVKVREGATPTVGNTWTLSGLIINNV